MKDSRYSIPMAVRYSLPDRGIHKILPAVLTMETYGFQSFCQTAPGVRVDAQTLH